MRKYLKATLAVLVAALVGFGGIAAQAANPPRNSNGGVFYDTSFIGVTSYLLHETVTPAQIASESGLLYGICRVGGTLGDYAVAYDYTTSDSLAILFSGGPGVSGSDPYIMSPEVFTDTEVAAGTYAEAESVRGCWKPPYPLRFEDGLVGENNSATGYSIFMWRADDGTNPI